MNALVEMIRNEEYSAAIGALNEGKNDRYIFKAIILAGGPGSGKSRIARELFAGVGLKEVNSDKLYEFMSKKAGIDLSDPTQMFSHYGQAIRGQAKDKTEVQKANYLEGKLGLVIDGTGQDLAKVRATRDDLMALGYDCMMVFVNTTLETSISRNQMRDRRLPDDEVKNIWSRVQSNISKFQSMFPSDRFVIVDNNQNMKETDYSPSEITTAKKMVRKFLEAPIRNQMALRWLSEATGYEQDEGRLKLYESIRESVLASIRAEKIVNG